VGKRKNRHCQSKQEVLQRVRQQKAEDQERRKPPLERQLQTINSIKLSIDRARAQMREKNRRESKQENRKQYREKQKQCGFCGPAGSDIAVIAPCDHFEYGLYIRVSGAYLQIYDGDYPGFIDNIEINYCPKCGRMLRKVEDNANGGI